jgi:hypothetical protein
MHILLITVMYRVWQSGSVVLFVVVSRVTPADLLRGCARIMHIGVSPVLRSICDCSL